MKIYITRHIPGTETKKLIDAGHEVSISDFDRSLTDEELLEKIKGVDAIITLLTDKIDGDVLDAAGPQLKIVSNYAVGFDNIDIKAASDRGIVITNTPCEAVNIAVAEHTLALIFNLARRVNEADKATKEGAYRGWEPDIFLGVQLKGKTLGIVGLGRIGTLVAQMAHAIGLNVVYTKKTQDRDIESQINAKFMSLDDLLVSSDFVSLHVPLTEETHHIINHESLAKTKKGSFLINTSRGSVVEEHALVDALRTGQLGGAGLDVFDNEPHINPELIGMQNIILTPHIASGTNEARQEMSRLAVKSILDFTKDVKPQNMVNEEVWPNRRK